MRVSTAHAEVGLRGFAEHYRALHSVCIRKRCFDLFVIDQSLTMIAVYCSVVASDPRFCYLRVMVSSLTVRYLFASGKKNDTWYEYCMEYL